MTGPPPRQLVPQFLQAVRREALDLGRGDSGLEAGLVVPLAGEAVDDLRGLVAVNRQVGGERLVRRVVGKPAVPADVLRQFAAEVVEEEPADEPGEELVGKPREPVSCGQVAYAGLYLVPGNK